MKKFKRGKRFMYKWRCQICGNTRGTFWNVPPICHSFKMVQDGSEEAKKG